MRPLFHSAIVLWVLSGLAGCSTWDTHAPRSESLLKPITLTDDGMQLEVISVRFPLGDPDFNAELWNKVDEQQLPLAVRRELAENGLRAGVLYGELPPVIAQKLSAAETRPASITEASARFERSAPATRQTMQLHSGWRGEILASGVYAELPLMMLDNGRLAGRTYPQAQGIIDAQVQALGDHRIKLHLTPQLQYGEARQQWVTEDGVIRPQTAKPKQAFERLTFDATLAQDQMLLVTSLPDRPGTLGNYFFTEQKDGQSQQKLVVIRLAESRYSDLFVPPSKGDAKLAEKSSTMR
jgi:hypothetical protein